MKFPLVIGTSKTLKIADTDFFESIGKLDLEAGTLEMNVTHEGTAGLDWLLDLDGIFYQLSSLGILPLTLMQRIGLSRAREKFRIIPGRRITVSELGDRISGLQNQFEEAPIVSYLKLLLGSLAPDLLVGPEEMLRYQGETEETVFSDEDIFGA
jgi:hypothetical protein